MVGLNRGKKSRRGTRAWRLGGPATDHSRRRPDLRLPPADPGKQHRPVHDRRRHVPSLLSLATGESVTISLSTIAPSIPVSPSALRWLPLSNSLTMLRG